MKNLSYNEPKAEIKLNVEINKGFIDIQANTNGQHFEVLKIQLADDTEINKLIVETAVSNFITNHLRDYL